MINIVKPHTKLRHYAVVTVAYCNTYSYNVIIGQ